MPKAKNAYLLNAVEPSVQPTEVFESPEDRERRLWSQNSGDWAFQILKFLQGWRKNEVTLSEVMETQTYLRSTPQEQNALKFVAAQAEQLRPLDGEDHQRLRERDDFLCRYADRKALGHQDWAEQIQSIPGLVAERMLFDQTYFLTQYPQPELFAWIWNPRQGRSVGDAPR